MDRVSVAEGSKYKYYLYQTTTSFCNTTTCVCMSLRLIILQPCSLALIPLSRQGKSGQRLGASSTVDLSEILTYEKKNGKTLNWVFTILQT